MLPILHLNGYKIANPCVLARISHEELEQLFRGYGYTPYFVEGHEPETMHQQMAATLDTVVGEIQRIQADARRKRLHRAPALADDRAAHAQGLDLPQGDRRQATEDYWRSHQVPMGEMHENPAHVRSARGVDEELPARRSCSTTSGTLKPELAGLGAPADAGA